MFDQFLNDNNFPGWEAGSYDDTFVCPHGTEIEADGECPDGCVSPLRQMGMI